MFIGLQTLIFVKEPVDKFGQMARYTKVGGRKTKQMEQEDLFMLMGMFMMDNG